MDKEKVRVLRREDFNLKNGVYGRPSLNDPLRRVEPGKSRLAAGKAVMDASQPPWSVTQPRSWLKCSTHCGLSIRPVASMSNRRWCQKPRSPEVIKEVPHVGIIAVRPATSLELERVPRDRGHQIANGELFRISERSSALLFVSRTAIASITPVIRRGTTAVGGDLLSSVRDLRIEWKPQAVAAR